MATAINRVILEFHNGSRTQGVVALEITGKGWYGWDHDDHLVLFTVACSSDNALDHSRTDLVLDWPLLITSSSDEKLVLNIHKMLAVLDDFAVRVLDRVL